MESPILKQIAKFLQDKKKYKRWLAVFVCLAVVVGFATTAALKMRGKAMTHDERVLNCKLQVHQHAETCYDQEKNIICGYADYVVHKHNDDCYDPHNGNLVCTLPEVEAHQHTDECYQEQQALACGLEESEGHQHTEECHTKEQGELTCQVEEHTHAEECQAEDGAFTCGKEEHTHADECYQWTETLACGQEESEGHHHTEACNQVQKTLICQKPEIEVHTHGDECYQRVLITPEGEEIVQDPKDNTGVAQEVLAGTANKEVPEGRIEVRRSCGKLQAEEHTHTQENGCIEIHEVLDGSDLRPVEETAAEGDAATAEGNENQESAPENGQTPMDGTEEEQTIVKTFEGDGFKVIAEYKKDANIPEEAELKAEQITAESDEAHFAEREAASKESIGDENATAKALLKIGFYVGEQEVEPETPVSVTVQLLDEKGLPEGAPITVVHFTEDGAEKIEGSKAEADSTTFEVNQFCEFMLLISDEDDTTNKVQEEKDGSKWIAVDKSYTFEASDTFNIIFSIAGKVNLPETVDVSENNEDTIQSPEKEDMGENISASEAGEKENAISPSDEDDVDEDDVDEIIESEEGSSADGEESGTEERSDSTDGEESGTEEESDSADGEESGTEEESDSADGESNGTETEDGKDTSLDTNKKGLKFTVRVLDDEEDEEYKSVVEYLQKIGREKGKELFEAGAVSYSLTYGSEEITDLSECKITAEIVPVVAEENDAEEKEESQIEVTAVQMLESGKVDQLDSVVIDGGDLSDAKTKKMSIQPQSKAFGYSASNTPNPNFTVQYYANLKRVAEKAGEETANSLDVLDTSGGNLPKNGNKDNAILKKVYLEEGVKEGTNLNQRIKVKTVDELTEIYSSRKYNYIMAPSIDYFDALCSNGGYTLMQVWVLKEGAKPDSLNEADWDIYIYREKENDVPKLHFTNREESASDDRIYIAEGSTIRLVYDTTTNETSNYPAVFYDYDISSKVDTGANGKFIMHTGKGGINSNLVSGQKGQYAFGNGSLSDFGENAWVDGSGKTNQLNKANGISYRNCTFGLVSGVSGEEVIFSKGINAPKLFGTAIETGKHRYDENSSLTFRRTGDSYTLHTATVNGQEAATNLDKFWWRKGWSVPDMWSNNFWPMDNIEKVNKEALDKKFGAAGKNDTQRYKLSDGIEKSLVDSLPSDDFLDHNSFFGMYYEVDFDLTAEYVGPLEYYFFGDDDMWVFLDGQLVCDIGGVHAAVGEYVDLWDYLAYKNADGSLQREVQGNTEVVKLKNPEMKSHKLQFFYTERGAAGSTCWMHFTLPSVTSKSPEDSKEDYGHLKINKIVAREDTEEVMEDVDQEFKFTIVLEDKDGNKLPDDYSYFKYNEGDDKLLEADLIIHTGGTFTLKNGQYIVIRYLPEGTKYTIQEEKYDDYHPQVESNGTATNDNDKPSEGNISGTIIKNSLTQLGLNSITYKNLAIIYNLPKTGGEGTILYTMAGVVAILLGAGFMYRKKFREGRVGGSS
ncbi:MAG: fibro-slime domain-containing protein [Lachnospiraceae bacterium]|nr:fibro-slime domain-containing protein [Lachnospiraceae bacterium]